MSDDTEAQRERLKKLLGLTGQPEVGIKRPTIITPAAMSYDYSRYSVNYRTQEVMFETKDRSSRLRVSFEGLEDHKERMTGNQWTDLQEGISRELRKRMSEFPKLGPNEIPSTKRLRLGEEHPTFGKLVQVGADGSAVYTKDGSFTRLTTEMVETVADGLEAAGIRAFPGGTRTIYVDKPIVLTAEQALLVILKEIETDTDPFVAAGQWLAKITNAITEKTREENYEA